MKLVWVIIPLVLIVSMIGIIVVQESFATEPCGYRDAEYHWGAYQNIYTGKVVSITNIILETNDDFVQENEFGYSTHQFKVDFELEKLLKGKANSTWHKIVSLNGFAYTAGINAYHLGDEIFFAESNRSEDNGPYIGRQMDGACGIGSSKVIDDRWSMPQDFINYFEEIYDIPAEPIRKCNNDNTKLTLRDNNKLVCVTENTANKLSWIPFENIGIQYQNTTNTEIKYDYPLLSETTKVNSNKITLSNLPKIGETATIMMSYTEVDDDLVRFTISNNFRFVEVDEKDIKKIDRYTDKEPGYYQYYERYYYFVDLLPPKMDHDGIFSVEIKAVSEGSGSIGASGRGSHLSLLMYVDSDQTLLVKDYYKAHYPLPENLFQRNIVDVDTTEKSSNTFFFLQRIPNPTGFWVPVEDKKQFAEFLTNATGDSVKKFYYDTYASTEKGKIYFNESVVSGVVVFADINYILKDLVIKDMPSALEFVDDFMDKIQFELDGDAIIKSSTDSNQITYQIRQEASSLDFTFHDSHTLIKFGGWTNNPELITFPLEKDYAVQIAREFVKTNPELNKPSENGGICEYQMHDDNFYSINSSVRFGIPFYEIDFGNCTVNLEDESMYHPIILIDAWNGNYVSFEYSKKVPLPTSNVPAKEPCPKSEPCPEPEPTPPSPPPNQNQTQIINGFTSVEEFRTGVKTNENNEEFVEMIIKQFKEKEKPFYLMMEPFKCTVIEFNYTSAICE